MEVRIESRTECIRRIDLWTGRAAAIAGIVWVALASVWPLLADAAVPSASPAVAASVEQTTAARLLSSSTAVDLRVARVFAEIVGKRSARTAVDDDPAVDAVVDHHEPASPDPATASWAALAVALVLAAVAWRDCRRLPASLDLEARVSPRPPHRTAVPPARVTP